MKRLLVVIKTNLHRMSNSEVFLVACAEFLSKILDVDSKNIVIELHTKVMIMRDGNNIEAMNFDIHHNTDKINKSTKVELSEKIAKFVYEKLDIHRDRTLVLFFDTRCCS
ncbi:hypothetical protein ACF0H5_010213 [Mactra antiquata]